MAPPILFPRSYPQIHTGQPLGLSQSTPETFETFLQIHVFRGYLINVSQGYFLDTHSQSNDMRRDSRASQSGNRWTPADDAQIETKIRNNTSLADVRLLFPLRTPEAVRKRYLQAVRKIHAENNPEKLPPARIVAPEPQPRPQPVVFAKARQLWTAEESQTLQDAIQKGMKFEEIRALFPDRPEKGVSRRMSRLDQKREVKDVEVEHDAGTTTEQVLGPTPDYVPGPVPDVRRPVPDLVIGPIPQDEDYLMSGALPVSTPHALSSPSTVRSWKAQAAGPQARSSTPPRPESEPLSPNLNAREDQVFQDYEQGRGDQAFQEQEQVQGDIGNLYANAAALEDGVSQAIEQYDGYLALHPFEAIPDPFATGGPFYVNQGGPLPTYFDDMFYDEGFREWQHEDTLMHPHTPSAHHPHHVLPQCDLCREHFPVSQAEQADPMISGMSVYGPQSVDPMVSGLDGFDGYEGSDEPYDELGYYLNLRNGLAVEGGPRYDDTSVRFVAPGKDGEGDDWEEDEEGDVLME